MGTRYATILVGGDVPDYGDNSPADDGAQTEANRVKYTTIQTDMGNPLDAGLKAMDAKLLTQTNEGPDIESGTVTLTTADHNTVQECSGTFALTLPNPSGNAGFQTTIKNNGIGVITVDVDGGANIDGVLSIELQPGDARKVYVNNAESAYYTAGRVLDGIEKNTVMSFFQVAAPTRWTQVTTHDNKMLRVVDGTGGGDGGTDSPILMDKVPSHTHVFSGNAVAAHYHLYWEDNGGTVSNQQPLATGTIAPVNSGITISSQQGMNAAGGHTPSGTNAVNASADNWEPLYIDMILASYDGPNG